MKLTDDVKLVNAAWDVWYKCEGSGRETIRDVLVFIQPHVDRLLAEAIAKEREETAAMLEVNYNPLGKLLANAVRARSKT